MMNQVMVVGRLRKIVDLGEQAIITLEHSRPYKNEKGEYEKGFIDFYINGGIKENIIEYCKQGDIMGVRGKIQTYNVEDKKEIRLIAEKISFLNTNTNLNKEEE